MFDTDPVAMAPDQLEAEMVELQGHINASTARQAALVAELDRRTAWQGPGLRSLPHWLMWKTGRSSRSSRDLAEMAVGFGRLAATAERAGRGELSEAQAAAICRVGTPSNEATLLDLARHSTVNQLERSVRSYRRVQETRPPAEGSEVRDRAHKRRYFSYHHDEADQSLVLRCRLPSEDGAVVIRAVEAARSAPTAPDPGAPHPQPEPRDPAVSRADGLVAVAEGYLAGHRRSRQSAERHELLLHWDLDRRSHLHDGPALAPDTMRRLGCDASAVAVLERSGEPLGVGRRTRTIPPSIRRALVARDDGCVFPGCNQCHHVDGHHLVHWADGGETTLDNLALLCRFHHRLVHEDDYGMEADPGGGFVFTRPSGSTIPRGPRPRPPTRPLADVHRDEGLSIDATTAACRWDGTRADHGEIVGALMGLDSG